jgi:hypothetical protein
VKSDWSVEWTVSATDSESVNDMFTAGYYDWTLSDGICSSERQVNEPDPTNINSGAELVVSNEESCAYDISFYYFNGVDSSSSTIQATT